MRPPICQPPSSAPSGPLCRYLCPDPTGMSYRNEVTRRWRVSKTDRPHSQLEQSPCCGFRGSVPSVRMPLPLSVDLDHVYDTSPRSPLERRRESLLARGVEGGD